jgi:NAD(P)H-hydrate epimerase
MQAVRHVRRLPVLPRRRPDAHKGDFGRVLVIGGSRGMIGAPALAANAALRSGAGLVTVACPRSIQLTVAALCPCATSIPLPENRLGLVDPLAALRHLRNLDLLTAAAKPTVIAAGPGLGQGGLVHSKALTALFTAFIDEAAVPLVLDADALNALAAQRATGTRPARPGRGGGWRELPRTIITPHPGEMARLHGVSTGAVQRDREGFALRTALALSGQAEAVDTRTVVVLKGAKTVVTNGVDLYVNRTGNAGMATGGSGDVLTGVIAALVAQGLGTFQAAVLGVYLHGLAGDLAAESLGQVCLTAADLIDCLPEAFKSRP